VRVPVLELVPVLAPEPDLVLEQVMVLILPEAGQ